ncbi:MAG TPA: serine hydrolase [Saprospiraceae bacterium]|nr:serine hydrolase [Saprospiraceae bacterium]HMQ82953.1 serine hydrolase [Saprospiraceae bacterium]
MNRLLIFVLCLFWALGGQAQSTDWPTFVKDSLDAYVERALQGWPIPGIAIGVVKGQELILAKGYGVLEAGKPEKVDANTLFMIGSNTKAFTGTLLAMLAEEGKCQLDDRVDAWLPEFDMKDDWVEQQVTLSDLVCHRLGMETFQGDFTYWTSNLSQREVLAHFGRFTPKYDFRTQWGYCNAGFLIAGLCMEPISGQTWDALIEERLFQPLGMDRSIALSANLSKATNAAKPHTLVEGQLQHLPIPMIDNLAPAGSISSSINDMSHWVMAHLNGGRYQDKQVIPEGAIQATRTPLSIIGRSQHPFNNSHYNLYGMGWVLEDYEGREIVSHTGGVNGFVTSVTLVPEEELGIIVLTNTDQNGFFEALKWEILDAYLGLPYRDYNGVFLQGTIENEANMADWRAKIRDTISMKLPTDAPLSAFAGRYQNDAYGDLSFVNKGDYLEGHFAHHSMTAKLEPLGGERFLCSFSDPTFGMRTVWFEVQDGQVQSFTLRVASFVEFTTYEFVKLE